MEVNDSRLEEFCDRHVANCDTEMSSSQELESDSNFMNNNEKIGMVENNYPNKDIDSINNETDIPMKSNDDSQMSGDLSQEKSAFCHSLPPMTTYEKIITLFTAFILVPIRLIMIMTLALVVWGVAELGMLGGDTPTFQLQPLVKGWRRFFQTTIWNSTGKFAFWLMGFKVVVKGEQAPRGTAPIIVAAPHSSNLDVFIISLCGGSPVARIENSRTMAMWCIQDLCHTIYVDRRSLESRQKAVNNIVERAKSLLPWPPLFIFPEGTTTNGTKLIRFQTGGFKPGVPVQPVTIMYSRPDLTTWTRDQTHTLLQSFMRILVTPVQQVTVEYLPVYYPDSAELDDPKVFAINVQKRMAESLGLEATDIQRTQFVMKSKKDKTE